MGNAGNFQAPLSGSFSDIVGSRLTLNRGIGCQDDLCYCLTVKTGFEPVEANFLGAYPVEWRQVPHQHMVNSTKTAALFDGNHISWRFNYTEKAMISALISAKLTGRKFCKILATLATTYSTECIRKRLRQRRAS